MATQIDAAGGVRMTPAEKAAVEAMARAPERWAAMVPEAVAAGSPAQMIYAIRDAQHDIALLVRALTTLHPGIGAVIEGSAVVVPRKLLSEAHACMRATGWQLAPASQSSDDGVIEAAVADIEERVGELLATPPTPGDAKEGGV